MIDDAFRNSFDLLHQCTEARIELEAAMILGTYQPLAAAVMNIEKIARENFKRQLPLLSSFSFSGELISKLYKVITLENAKAKEDLMKAEKRWPTAQYLKSAVTAEDGYSFEGYSFWYDELDEGWGISNCYGIDNIAYVKTLADFKRFIDYLANQEEDSIWDEEPPSCYEPPLSEQLYDAEMEHFKYQRDVIFQFVKDG